MAAITHPDCASLVDPLFAARKEGKRFFIPSFRLAGERVVERSDDRVSNRRHAIM